MSCDADKANTVQKWAKLATTLSAFDNVTLNDNDLFCLCLALERHHQALMSLIAESHSWHADMKIEIAARDCASIRDLFDAVLSLIKDQGRGEFSKMYFSVPRTTYKHGKLVKRQKEGALGMSWDYDKYRISERVCMVWNFMDWIMTHEGVVCPKPGKVVSVWDDFFSKRDTHESAEVWLLLSIAMQATHVDIKLP